jgi:glycerate kinase
MKRILKAITSPLTVEAMIQFSGVFQMVSARMSAMANASGMALVAGHRNPAINTKMATMGSEATRASRPADMIRFFWIEWIKISKIFHSGLILLFLLIHQELVMKVLIAPDSFKDCLGAPEVARALGHGIMKILPDARIRTIPMADGGEGTVEAIIDATGGKRVRVQVKDPLMREITSFYGISGDGSTAVIEMAAASGLELLEPGERDPWITSTYGTGQLIGHAMEQGCSKIMVGIGGSATNDGGLGMAEALGVRFLNEHGHATGQGGGAVGDVRKIVMDGLNPRIAHTEILVACDVTNPLTGPEGASFTYGPQKGAGGDMVKRLDGNLGRFADLIREQVGRDIDRLPGAGAAGGLGAGLVAFLGATLVKGFTMVAECVGLEKEVENADLVITGEGTMDRQTQFGKTPFGVAQLAKKHGKPVIGVAGTLEEGYGELYEQGFRVILSIQEKPVSLEQAILNAPALLERTGEKIARMLRMKV